ncbi:hypothetical protein VOI54_06480 [Tamlana sp. 2201CG12-4]|uniref:hypothetical protein n=1 Tax=Tamlana sp. 2201CG12-4 TaxID=3112582 RepID=UPI002DB73B59|nr:hypothetical protein [Tamlana sp. 2201CG12-4]MEC3906658.1 hypothetical protein [Tamlana sp. 2201CG12-4]
MAFQFKEKTVFIFIWFVFCFGFVNCASAENMFGESNPDSDSLPMKVNIVILNPKDREIPDFAVKMLREIADYTRHFYVTEMTKQGYPPKHESIFELDQDGDIKIYTANSPLTMVELEKVKHKKKHAYNCIDQPKSSYDNAVWWIFSNITNEVKYGFNGGGTVSFGTAIVNLPQAYEKIDNTIPLASSGYFVKHKLKALLHELGHALQLPHNGPAPGFIEKDPNGNTLMGPTNKAFKQHYNTEDNRVYLSKLSAAILWKHPVFNHTNYKPFKTIDFVLTDIKINRDSIKNTAKLTGRINTKLPYHSVVLIDAPKNKRRHLKGNKSIRPLYRDRGYVAKIDENGIFEFNIDKMTSKSGHFLIAVCFNNGLTCGAFKKPSTTRLKWMPLEYQFQ